MAKGQAAAQKQLILELLKKNRGAALSLADIALHARIPKEQVLTLLGQLKGEVECVSRATMESTVSMKWEDVDSKWRIAGAAATKAPVKWPPRPGSAPFGSETAAELDERSKKNRLSPERLVLAAWLGHPGAREVLGAKAPEEPADLTAWFQGLLRWKEETRVLGLAAAARRALPAFEAARPGDERPRRAVDAALAYGKTPKSEQAHLATGTALGAEEAAKAAPEGPPRSTAFAAFRLGILISAIEAGKPAEARAALVAEVVGHLASVLPDPEIRTAVRDELGPRALA